MTRIAYLVTSAREMTLADGSTHPTGYFAEEALKPYQRFVAAGLDVTVITPDGKPPYADPYGLSWFFHYPEEDTDYLASVVRTFAHDVDDIRRSTSGSRIGTIDEVGASRIKVRNKPKHAKGYRLRHA